MPRIRKRGAKAAVRAYCSELGEGFVPRVIDFEICPYLPLDDHHDIEVAGYVAHENDGMKHVNVILWRVPDSRRPSSAHELMRVTLVPNGPGVVREVCDWLAAHIDEAELVGPRSVDYEGWRTLARR